MTYTKFTPEQYDIVEHAQNIDGILLVSAGAGTGKSFLAEQITLLLKPARGLYTAFNKAIVHEGVLRFEGTNMECKTLHALAYRYVKPTQPIEDISYSCIKEQIPYSAKAQIITAINEFYVSASVDMFEFMDNHFEETSLRDLALIYIEKMVAGELNPTFNFLLKYFHLLLVEGEVKIKYDLIILDEINDTTGVALEIFKLLQAPKKLGLGETNQAIYDFLNLVDGFEELKEAPVLNLTQSFRCSTEVASRIDRFMKHHVNESFSFIGTDEPVRNGKTLACTLTNAKIVHLISERLRMNKGFTLLREAKEIFAYPLAITSAAKGNEVYQKKYRYLETEYKEFVKNKKKNTTFLSHLLEHVGDQETKSAVNLLLTLSKKSINLFDLYAKAKEAREDPKYTIATVYTSKGLEYETVYISDDLNNRIETIVNNGGIETHEDLVAFRCYYVAASRCGVDLRNATALNLF